MARIWRGGVVSFLRELASSQIWALETDTISYDVKPPHMKYVGVILTHNTKYIAMKKDNKDKYII